MPSPSDTPTFVLSGAAESLGVQSADSSPAALRAKTADIVGALDERMSALGIGWEWATTAAVYTNQDLCPAIDSELLPKLGSKALNGVLWFPSDPPVSADIELGLWGVRQEITLSSDL